MSEFTPADYAFMARAIRLARRGDYTSHPNPRVGCVLVNSGKVVGEGWHHKTGEAHAEANALIAAGEQARGCTAYVTLEPCSHSGKTPPCSRSLIEAGVATVIAAMDDPNPKVAGSGINALRESGMDVRVGLMETQARRLNEGFISRFERARPFVRLKIATSLDGGTAMTSGESQWITGEAAREAVQKLRARSGAVMTGVGSVVADDPSLTVRDNSIAHAGLQPVRIVLDSHLRMSAAARMIKLPGTTVVFCVSDGNRRALENAGAEIRVIPAADGRPDLAAVMAELAGMEINDVLVEAGPLLAGSLLNCGLVDELVIFQAPHLLGSETRHMLSTPTWLKLEQKLALNLVDVRMTGQDLQITARPIKT